MPEGHKTHFLAGQHTKWFSGQKLKITSPQGRFADDAKKVTGKVLDRVEAVGKHMFYVFDDDQIINVHLGRYGKFRQSQSPPPVPIGLVRMRIEGPEQTIDLTGPTTCRVIDSATRQAIQAKLGPDPLAGGNKADVWKAITSSKKPIGSLLLDQSVIAGIGNIFRAEVLFEIGLDPTIAGDALSKQSFDQMWKSISKLMKVGLKYGKIVSVTAKEAGMPLAKVEGKDRFRVYGKQRCPRCGAKIQVAEIAGRKLYFCAKCQS